MIATGLGSMPGDNARECISAVLAEFEDLAFLPELPARGPSGGMIGRTTAMLDGLAAELVPSGWRLAAASGIDHRRAIGMLAHDLDDLEELAQGYRGTIAITACGPMTLAAAVELRNGEAAVSDAGARREIAESLASGLGELTGQLRERLPDVRLVAQIDEPMLPAVASGRVRTASGFARYAAVDAGEASAALGRVRTAVVDALIETGDAGGRHRPTVDVRVHCCAPGLGLGLLTSAGIRALSADLDQPPRGGLDAITAWLERGGDVLLGVQPTRVPDALLSVDALARRASRILRSLRLSPDLLDHQVVLTPACGLAGWTPAAALEALRRLRRAAEQVGELLHE